MNREEWKRQVENDISYMMMDEKSYSLTFEVCDMIADYFDENGLWNERVLEGNAYLATALIEVYTYYIAFSEGVKKEKPKDVGRFIDFVRETCNEEFIKIRMRKDAQKLDCWSCADFAYRQAAVIICDILKKG